LRQRAQLQNATYRLVIDMQGDDAAESAATEGESADSEPAPPAKSKNKKNTRRVTYWIEKGTGSLVNSYDAKNPPKLPKPGEKKDEDAPADAFQPDTSIFKKKMEMEKGLEIESVELGRVDDIITTGIVYIHYLPSGYVDEAVIHLKVGDKLKWSLATEPLTGRMDIIPEYRALKDIRSQ
jgi:hypothetical protein